MSVTFLKAILLTTIFASAASIVGLVVWAFWTKPVDMPNLALPAPRTTTTPEAAPFPATERSFDSLAWLTLLGTPNATSSTAGVTEERVVADPIFAIQLVGTWIEGEKKYGLFRDQIGGYDRKSTGQTLALSPAGVEVDSVDSGSAVLRYAGDLIQVAIPEPYRQVVSQPPPASESGNGGMNSYNTSYVPPPPSPMWSANGNSPTSDSEDIFAPIPESMNPTGNPYQYGQPANSDTSSAPVGNMGSSP